MSKNRYVAKSVLDCEHFVSFSSLTKHTNWLGLTQHLCVTGNSLYIYPENVPKTRILNIVVFRIKVDNLCA